MLPNELANAMEPIILASMVADMQDIKSLHKDLLKAIPEQTDKVTVDYNGKTYQLDMKSTKNFIAVILLEVMTPKNISALISNALFFKFNNMNYDLLLCNDVLKNDIIKIMDEIKLKELDTK